MFPDLDWLLPEMAPGLDSCTETDDRHLPPSPTVPVNVCPQSGPGRQYSNGVEISHCRPVGLTVDCNAGDGVYGVLYISYFYIGVHGWPVS